MIFTRFYLDLINFCDNVKFTFKIHPSDDLNESKKILENQSIENKELDLKSFDLILSHWSTMIYEAAENGVPFILVNPEGKFDYKQWRLENYPFIVKNKLEFIDYLNAYRKGRIDFISIINDLIDTNLGADQSNYYNEIEQIITE